MDWGLVVTFIGFFIFGAIAGGVWVWRNVNEAFDKFDRDLHS